MRCFQAFLTAGLTAVALLVLPAASAHNGTTSTTPMQLRLAYAGSTGMSSSWNTSNPTVNYGLSASALNQTTSSNISVTYPTSLTFNNHVKITGLEPNTLYYYQPDNSNSSTPFTFKTSRAAGDGTPYSIAVVVDLGLMGPQGTKNTCWKRCCKSVRTYDNNTI
jgi:acid phosphatase type 7